MITALVPRVPSLVSLVTSGCGLVMLALTVVHGNAMPKRTVRVHALMVALATAAGAAMYVAVWAVPLYGLRPWGLAMIVWTGLSLAWLLVAELHQRDYALCIAALAMVGLLAVSLLDFAGVSNRILVVGQIWVLLTAVLLSNRQRVVSAIGRQRAWRLFQLGPAAAERGARGFYQAALDHARRRHDRRWLGMAQVRLACCLHAEGDAEQALALVREATETLDGVSAAWRGSAYVQLAQWLLTAGDHDEAEGVANLALDITSPLARAQRIRAWALLLRAICRAGRDDGDGAAQDVAMARALLRRHPDPQLVRILQDLQVRLTYAER